MLLQREKILYLQQFKGNQMELIGRENEVSKLRQNEHRLIVHNEVTMKDMSESE